MTTKQQLLARLEPVGQAHLLDFWDQLDDPRRQLLADQIQALDFALIRRLFENRDHLWTPHVEQLGQRAQPPSAIREGVGNPRLSPADAKRRGTEALQAGQIGAIVVAGGQGTRLGFPHPKGLFPIGPVSHHSLFQIHVEKLRARSARHRTRIPLAVMTSPATHQETLDFFALHRQFGLPEDDLCFFCQATMPCVDAQNGRILLAEPHQVALSPDGHGGVLAALVRSGTLARLRARGIEHLFYFQVDNPLVDIAAPELIGYHLLANSDLSTLVVRKRTGADRLGNVVEVDGRLHVIEYIDLPRRLAERRNDNGTLWLWAGSIGVHVVAAAFLERMAEAAEALPFHVTRKRVAYVDKTAGRVEPDTPNALKFERFFFDLMPQAQCPILIEVDAARHFAPLKNAPGSNTDTPEAVRAQMVALHTDWLRQAGVVVAPGVPVEISPLLALDAQELLSRPLPPGPITAPTYFPPIGV